MILTQLLTLSLLIYPRLTIEAELDRPHIMVEDIEYDVLISYYNKDRNADYILDVVYVGKVKKFTKDDVEMVKFRIPIKYKRYKHNLKFMLIRLH